MNPKESSLKVEETAEKELEVTEEETVKKGRPMTPYERHHEMSRGFGVVPGSRGYCIHCGGICSNSSHGGDDDY